MYRAANAFFVLWSLPPFLSHRSCQKHSNNCLSFISLTFSMFALTSCIYYYNFTILCLFSSTFSIFFFLFTELSKYRDLYLHYFCYHFVTITSMSWTYSTGTKKETMCKYLPILLWLFQYLTRLNIFPPERDSLTFDIDVIDLGIC